MFFSFIYRPSSRQAVVHTYKVTRIVPTSLPPPLVRCLHFSFFAQVAASIPSHSLLVDYHRMERVDCTDRTRLRGLGEEILILVVQHAPKAQLTEWLKLPLELSEGDADFLLKPSECCQVRRKGEEVLTVVMERASPKQWCKWLQIPLEHALLARKPFLVERLIAAGSGFGGPAADIIASARVGAAGNARVRAAGNARVSAGGGGSGGGNGGRRDGGQKMAGCSPRVRFVQARPLPPSSCCKPQEDAISVNAVFAAATAGAAGGAVSQPSCCTSSGSPVRPPACRELPLERREKARSAAARCRRPAVAVVGCAPAASSGDANLDLPIPVIDVDGAAALVNSDKLCLHRATMARDLVRMRQIISGGVDCNATDLWSCTALHRAAEQDDAEPVRLLLAAGLDVRARDMEGYSPLHFASARGAATAIVDLLAAGSCLSDRGLNGDTPLHSAVRFLSLATVRILLASDADENAKNGEGHTPADVTGVLPDGRDIENQPDPLIAESILALLAAAPAQRRNRTWKRRSWLVMLRARAQAEALKAAVDLSVRDSDDVTGSMLTANHAGGGGEPVDDSTLRDETAGIFLNCVPTKCCVSGGGVSSGGVTSDSVVGGGSVSAGDDGAGDGDVDSELLDLVDQTTSLAEEGVFQKIVRFL